MDFSPSLNLARSMLELNSASTYNACIFTEPFFLINTESVEIRNPHLNKDLKSLFLRTLGSAIPTSLEIFVQFFYDIDLTLMTAHVMRKMCYVTYIFIVFIDIRMCHFVS